MAAIVATISLGACASSPPKGNHQDPGGNAKVPFVDEIEGNKLFGFSDTTFAAPSRFNPDDLSAEETIKYARAAGANSTRLVFAWRLAEPAPGQWDENYIREMQKVAEGFPRRPVITLAFAPPWANPKLGGSCPPGFDCRYPPDDANYPQWETFVRRAVKEFPVADFEVWNEPNFSSFWYPAIDAKGYMKLVKSTYGVIQKEKAAGHTKAKVLAGSLAQLPDNGIRSQLPWHFLDKLYDEGLKGNYDRISWHTYAAQIDDKIDGFGANSYFARDWAEMRKVVRQHAPGSRFMITEAGVTRTGPGSKASEAEQAVALRTLVRKELGMSDVDAVFVHTLLSWSLLPKSGRDYGLAVIKTDGTEGRVATRAYCTLVREAHGSTSLCR